MGQDVHFQLVFSDGLFLVQIRAERLFHVTFRFQRPIGKKLFAIKMSDLVKAWYGKKDVEVPFTKTQAELAEELTSNLR